ncbi:MAG: site-specific integrase [Bacillota bacterium]
MDAITINFSGGIDPKRLIELFLSGRKATTLRAYGQDLADFAAFVQADGIEDAARLLLTKTAPEANALAFEYLNQMLARNLSPKTINRRLSSLRSLVQLGRTLGLVNWQLEVRNLKARAYRDTRGPGKKGVKRMLDYLAGQSTPKSYRDAAIIHLLFDRGLRRGEVAGLDLSDVDAARCRIRVVGKGEHEAQWLTIPRLTLEAIARWLVFRGLEPGPLFYSLSNIMPQGRLSDHGIYKWVVVKTARRSGLGHVRPHGLRHAGITHALDKTSGNLRAVAQFARHKRVDTTMIYDDNRLDVGGQIADLIAGD